MTDRELLLYIYGYLNGVLHMSKISSQKISTLKGIILLQQERNKAKLEIITTYNDQVTIIDDEFEKDYKRDFFREENNSNDNDKYYNENLDLDQQDPDFYS